MSFDGKNNSLWAASSSSFDRDKGHGIVYQLEPSTLKTKSAVKIARLGFATALDEEHERLYIGNTLDGSVTVIDTLTGKELSVIPLTEGQDEAHFRPTREMVIDKKISVFMSPAPQIKGLCGLLTWLSGRKLKPLMDWGTLLLELR